MSALASLKKGHLGQKFVESAKVAIPPKAKKSSVVVCVRMSTTQRSRLRREASGRNVSAYVRKRLFSDTRPDGHESLSKAKIAYLLGQLGKSGLAGSMCEIANAVQTGTLETGPHLDEKLERACNDIAAMRRDLIRALGIVPE